MSNISNRHSITEFDSKTSKPLDGQRLAKVGYKTSKTGKKSQCASIPRIASSEISIELLQAFKPYVQQLLEDTQDKIVRQAYEAGATEISSEQLSIAKCIEYIDAESRGDRLTKESISEWFNDSLADVLTLAFADKLGVSDTPTVEEGKKIEAIVTSYKEKIASLSGHKTYYPVDVCEKLEKALELADSDDVTVQRLQKKLTVMKQNPVTVDMLGL